MGPFREYPAIAIAKRSRQAPMFQEEGTIQFTFDLQPGRGLHGLEDALRPLFAWRAKLRELRLIGQIPGRYGGLGFGNPEHARP